MRGRDSSNSFGRHFSVGLNSSLSTRSTHLQSSNSSLRNSSNLSRDYTSPKLTLQARQRQVSIDLLRLNLENESSEEDIPEKPEIPDTQIPSNRLKNIISSKFGIGSAKNKHAAAMNALLRLRPKNSGIGGNQEDLRKISSDWMKTLINRVWTIYKFSKIMSMYSSSLLERSARMEAEDVMRGNEYQNKQKSNNIPSLPIKFRSLLPPRYIKILYKYPSSRTNCELSELSLFLRSSNNEFKQYSETTQISLCKSMYYECFEKGRVILRQGQPGNNFYIILSGSLVWMRSDIDKETGDVYTCDNVMKAGEKFGEIALIRKRMRTATIVCCEDSELLMVDKKLFDQFCPNLFNEQLKLKMLAVKDVDLFRDWNQSDLEEVVLETRLQEFPINKVVVRDSMECPLFYLVMEGKCRVLKEINISEMEKRLGCVSQNSNRHFHLSELPKSKYSQNQITLTNDRQINNTEAKLTGVITRDGKAYLQLRELVTGDIFELTEMYKSHVSKTGFKLEIANTQSLMLVSNGSKLLEITKSKFKSKAGGSFLDTLHKYFIKYPREDQLFRDYKQHTAWIIYKREMVNRELKFQKAKGIKRTAND
eukprot:TRINITY_DN9833_c0_g3_i3.p1 TRINITY_DN9833_c0_g3~~TRINITY_DN9833_c0_g3_i3.p1  ORF type:complete len:593 (+),score=100.12 TRINITY_DN9833_c0_g3_i3:61-1839(+)